MGLIMAFIIIQRLDTMRALLPLHGRERLTSLKLIFTASHV